MLLIQDKEDVKKVQAKNNIFYFELSSRTNVDIIGIKLSMRK